MTPIVFWCLGTLTLLASLIAVVARRPARSVQAFVVIMAATAIMVFLLSAPLLGTEMLVVIAGAVLAVWAIVVRPGRMKLGPPGRARLNITRLVGFFVALWLTGLLLWALANAPNRPPPAGGPVLGGAFGSWAALMLIGTAAVTTWLVVAGGHGDDEQGGER